MILRFLILLWLLCRIDISFGLCMDSEQNGLLYNGEPYYNYISYSGTEAKAGDMVLTVALLNPFNNYCDDVVYRADFIVKESDYGKR